MVHRNTNVKNEAYTYVQIQHTCRCSRYKKSYSKSQRSEHAGGNKIGPKQYTAGRMGQKEKHVSVRLEGVKGPNATQRIYPSEENTRRCIRFTYMHAHVLYSIYIRAV